MMISIFHKDKITVLKKLKVPATAVVDGVEICIIEFPSSEANIVEELEKDGIYVEVLHT